MLVHGVFSQFTQENPAVVVGVRRPTTREVSRQNVSACRRFAIQHALFNVSAQGAPSKL